MGNDSVTGNFPGILCFIYMKKKYDVLKTEQRERKLDMHYIKTLFTMAVPMGLQFSITAIGSIMLQSAVNTLGAVYVSSFATAAKVKQLAMRPIVTDLRQRVQLLAVRTLAPQT